MREPNRILDDPASSEELLDLMKRGTEVVPTEEQVASLAQRLGLPLPPDGSGGGGVESPVGLSSSAVASSALRSGMAWKAGAVAGAVVVALTVGFMLVTRSGPSAGRFFEGVSFSVEMESSGEDVPGPSSSGQPEASARQVPVHGPSPKRLDPEDTSSKSSDQASEAAMLRRARALLSSDPSAALAITQEHRRRFPKGVLAQEREVIAIEALSRLGKKREATDRAEKFEAAHPDSPHRDKVESSVR